MTDARQWRAQVEDGAPRLFEASTGRAKGALQPLAGHRRIALEVAERSLDVQADRGQALRQRIVNLARQPRPFAQHQRETATDLLQA